MRKLTLHEIDNVSGSTYNPAVSLATSAISGLISGVSHNDWRQSVIIDALINGVVAYIMAPAAILSMVGCGVVIHTTTYLLGDYMAQPA